MTSFNQKFTLRNQHALRRSYICEPQPHQHHQVSIHERPNLLKRSSFTPTPSQNNYDCSTPAKPEISSARDVMHSSHGTFYHQSSYYVNQKNQNSNSKASIDQKFDRISSSRKENCSANDLEEKINKIAAKLNKTASLVERHEKLFRTEGMDLGVNYWRNNIGLRHVLEESLADQLKFKERDWTIQNNLVKGEIEAMRKMLKEVPLKPEITSELSTLQTNMTHKVSQMIKNLTIETTQMTKFQQKQKQQNMKYLEGKFEQLLKRLEQRIKVLGDQKKDEDTQSSNNSFCQLELGLSTTQRTFIGDPILLKLSTKFSAQIGKKQTKIEECEDLYKIDEEGFLLDWENKYLIDQSNRKIKLTSLQIDRLKKLGILKNK